MPSACIRVHLRQIPYQPCGSHRQAAISKCVTTQAPSPGGPNSLGEQAWDSAELHRRADYEALLSELEDAEDRAAIFEYELAKAKRSVPEPLTIEEVERLREGEHPVKIWREKRQMAQRALAAAAEISPTLLSEIEGGTKTGSVDTLRKLAHALKVDVDALLP